MVNHWKYALCLLFYDEGNSNKHSEIKTKRSKKIESFLQSDDLSRKSSIVEYQEPMMFEIGLWSSSSTRSCSDEYSFLVGMNLRSIVNEEYVFRVTIWLSEL